MEYPPGFFLATLPAALVTGHERAYCLLFQCLMALAISAALVFAARALATDSNRAPSSWEMAAWGAVATLTLGVVATHRYDASVALGLAITAWAIATRRPLVLGAAMAASVALKGVPLLVIPVLVIHLVRERKFVELGKALTAGTLVTLLLGLPAVWVAGDRLVEMIRYHVDRPLQIESTGGALLGLLHAVAPSAAIVQKTFGSTNIISPLSRYVLILSAAASVASVVMVCAVTWVRLGGAKPNSRPRITIEGMAAVLALNMSVGKVFSPQYLVWLVPIGIAISLATDRSRRLVLLLSGLALSQVIYPVTYSALELLRPWACALVITRNGVILLWATTLLRPWAGSEREGQAASAGTPPPERRRAPPEDRRPHRYPPVSRTNEGPHSTR